MSARDDRGSTAVELAILAPAFAVMLALVILVGRTQSSRADLDAAAHSAVRTITLSRDPATATEQARLATAERLEVGSPACRTFGWDVAMSATEASVTVSCTVDLSEAALLPVPGTLQVEATSSEVFDRFLEKGES